MAGQLSATLARLERTRFEFRPGASRRKRALLERLQRSQLQDADSVLRLHELLRFMDAYPDDAALRVQVVRMLKSFSEREDVREFREELINSGIAGTEVQFSFYWFTLCRLVQRWPDRLEIDWPAFRGRQREMLDKRLLLLMPYCETLALEEATMTTREWLARLKAPTESEAEFLVRRFAALHADEMPREGIFEEMDVPFRLLPGPDTPSETLNRLDTSPVRYQKRPPERSRDSFAKELERPPIRPRSATRREVRRLLEMALNLMVARTRDLDCFVHADDNDVRIVDYPEGFQLVCIGSTPQRRQMLDAAYGFLMLRNGVLIGYVLSASLFGSSEVAYNLSPPFRGAEAAHLYARCLHAVKHMFVVDTFMVDPYQMGHGNPEGLRSGAWWFYYKLGFRPLDPAIARLAERERVKARETSGYRSSLNKLERLSSVNMYLNLGEPRDDVIGEFSRENVGLHIVRYLAERFGADREQGLERCAAEVAERVGLRRAELTEAEAQALLRWAPLISILPGVDQWSARDLADLARVVRAKGGRRESDFVRRFDRHRALRRAVFELSLTAPD